MANHIISMSDNAYTDQASGTNPAVTVVHVGDTVTWKNDGGARHNAANVDGPTFDTGDINPGDTATITFSQPSTGFPDGFKYNCSNHHPHMIGHVVVTLAGSNLRAVRDNHAKKNAKPA